MRAHVFTARGALPPAGGLPARVPLVLESLAKDTDTSDLVVAVYLLPRRQLWQGHAYTRPVGPGVFTRPGRRWEFASRFGPPPDLPPRFPLIRMAFGMREEYPRVVTDMYEWEIRCVWFEDLLAYTFAHELHHYRRYHLHLHDGEGEQAACRWALKRAADAGYRVTGKRLPRRKSAPPDARFALPKDANPGLVQQIKTFAARLCAEDLAELKDWLAARLRGRLSSRHDREHESHFALIRGLPPGAPLLIQDDGRRGRYAGQTAAKVRNLRRPSYRVVVRTSDGREWHWPMQWVRPAAPPALPVKQKRLFDA